MSAQIQLSTPGNLRVFSLSDTPDMPVVTVLANLTPAIPAAAMADFYWSFALRFTGDETPHGKPGTPVFLSKTTKGGYVTLQSRDWAALRAGRGDMVARRRATLVDAAPSLIGARCSAPARPCSGIVIRVRGRASPTP